MRAQLTAIAILLFSGGLITSAEAQEVRGRISVRTPEVAASLRFRDGGPDRNYERGRRDARQGWYEEREYFHGDSQCSRYYDRESYKDCLEDEREYWKDVREAEREQAKAWREHVRESLKDRREAEREYLKARREHERERAKRDRDRRWDY
ncbi:MAG TPA: hypothetical protein VJ817_08440 [Gemmatimonadales bacterium]|nr:hypothetical protein [Gemmatimonadales bacterium]